VLSKKLMTRIALLACDALDEACLKGYGPDGDQDDKDGAYETVLNETMRALGRAIAGIALDQGQHETELDAAMDSIQKPYWGEEYETPNDCSLRCAHCGRTRSEHGSQGQEGHYFQHPVESLRWPSKA
jgi:hypothetical protein